MLLIRKPAPLVPDTREAEAWAALSAHLRDLSDRYANELGENAYAVLNAVTDFASRPPSNRCVRRDRHSLQQLAGTWLSTFSRLCREPRFSLSGYLKKLAEANAASAATAEATAYRNN